MILPSAVFIIIIREEISSGYRMCLDTAGKRISLLFTDRDF